MRDYNKQKYLKLLSKEYKNITEVSEEIINLKAILNLPKGSIFKWYSRRICTIYTYFE